MTVLLFSNTISFDLNEASLEGVANNGASTNLEKVNNNNGLKDIFIPISHLGKSEISSDTTSHTPFLNVFSQFVKEESKDVQQLAQGLEGKGLPLKQARLPEYLPTSADDIQQDLVHFEKNTIENLNSLSPDDAIAIETVSEKKFIFTHHIQTPIQVDELQHSSDTGKTINELLNTGNIKEGNVKENAEKIITANNIPSTKKSNQPIDTQDNALNGKAAGNQVSLDADIVHNISQINEKITTNINGELKPLYNNGEKSTGDKKNHIKTLLNETAKPVADTSNNIKNNKEPLLNDVKNVVTQKVGTIEPHETEHRKNDLFPNINKQEALNLKDTKSLELSPTKVNEDKKSLNTPLYPTLNKLEQSEKMAILKNDLTHWSQLEEQNKMFTRYREENNTMSNVFNKKASPHASNERPSIPGAPFPVEAKHFTPDTNKAITLASLLNQTKIGDTISVESLAAKAADVDEASTTGGNKTEETGHKPSALTMPMSSGNGVDALERTQQISQPLQLHARQWQSDFAHKITWMLRSGVETAEIQLDPPELGPLTIKVSQQNGSTQVAIQVNHSQTRELFEQNMDKLKDILDNAEIQLNQGKKDGEASHQSPEHLASADRDGEMGHESEGVSIIETKKESIIDERGISIFV